MIAARGSYKRMNNAMNAATTGTTHCASSKIAGALRAVRRNAAPLSRTRPHLLASALAPVERVHRPFGGPHPLVNRVTW